MYRYVYMYLYAYNIYKDTYICSVCVCVLTDLTIVNCDNDVTHHHSPIAFSRPPADLCFIHVPVSVVGVCAYVFMNKDCFYYCS